MIKKTSGNYNILDSGSIIAFDKSSNICFDLDLNESLKFTLTLNFVEKEKEKPSIASSVTNDAIVLVCTNFEDEFGVGLIDPIRLAIADDKEVYFRFWVRKIGKSGTKEVVYTFYVEK